MLTRSNPRSLSPTSSLTILVVVMSSPLQTREWTYFRDVTEHGSDDALIPKGLQCLKQECPYCSSVRCITIVHIEWWSFYVGMFINSLIDMFSCDSVCDALVVQTKDWKGCYLTILAVCHIQSYSSSLSCQVVRFNQSSCMGKWGRCGYLAV